MDESSWREVGFVGGLAAGLSAVIVWLLRFVRGPTATAAHITITDVRDEVRYVVIRLDALTVRVDALREEQMRLVHLIASIEAEIRELHRTASTSRE